MFSDEKKNDFYDEFLRTLHDPKLCQLFYTFLENLCCAENLAFFLEVTEYNSLTTQMERQVKGQEIYSLYVENLGLNLDIQQVKTLQESIPKGLPHCFDDSLTHITNLMLADSFVKFRFSPAYQAHFEKRKQKLRRIQEEIRQPVDPTGLTATDWELLLATAELREVKKDTVVLKEGEVMNYLCRIKSGGCHTDEAERNLKFKPITLGPLDIFGSYALPIPATAPFTLKTFKNSQIWYVDSDWVYQVCQSNHALAGRLYHWVAIFLANKFKESENRSINSNPFFGAFDATPDDLNFGTTGSMYRTRNASVSARNASLQTLPIFISSATPVSLSQEIKAGNAFLPPSCVGIDIDDSFDEEDLEEYRAQIIKASSLTSLPLSVSSSLSPQGLQDKERTKIFSTLGLPKEQLVIQSFHCSTKKMKMMPVPYHGHFFITKSFVCFYSKVLHSKLRIIIPIKELLDISAQKNELILMKREITATSDVSPSPSGSLSPPSSPQISVRLNDAGGLFDSSAPNIEKIKFNFEDSSQVQQAFRLISKLRGKEGAYDGLDSSGFSPPTPHTLNAAYSSAPPALLSSSSSLGSSGVSSLGSSGVSSGVSSGAPGRGSRSSSSSSSLSPSGASILDDIFKEDDWQFIISMVKLLKFAPGSKMVAQYEKCGCLFQIAQGSCVVKQLRTVNGATEEVFIRNLNEGDFFGEISFLTHSPATATVIVNPKNLSDAYIYVLDRYMITSVFDARPALVGKFFQYLSIILLKRMRDWVQPAVVLEFN